MRREGFRLGDTRQSQKAGTGSEGSKAVKLIETESSMVVAGAGPWGWGLGVLRGAELQFFKMKAFLRSVSHPAV